MYQYIEKMAASLYPELCALRMDFHRFPETAWNEVRTTKKIEAYLNELGYETITGHAVANHDTGVIGILHCGAGPTAALRFDIDGLPISESTAPTHIPVQKDFRSCHTTAMHACGHDGHLTIGLGCAKLLSMLKKELSGTIKLIFQPAEEGARGAIPIVANGWLDDVDYFLAAHIFQRPKTMPESCNIITGVSTSLATTKRDVFFHGTSAHAAHPEQGHDVILPMAEIIRLLKQLPTPGFVQIGTITAGNGRNIIADYGKLELETRAPSTQRDQELNTSLLDILTSVTENYHIQYEQKVVGSAPSVESTPELSDVLTRLFTSCAATLTPAPSMFPFPASEDVSHMIRRVKENGGQASFMLFPAKLAADLHHYDFDFPMSLLKTGVAAFTMAIYHLLRS